MSLVWLWLLPYKTLHEQLAQSYFALARYLQEKSCFSWPTSTAPRPSATIWLQLNINLVNALNSTRRALTPVFMPPAATGGPELAGLLGASTLLALEIQERATPQPLPYSKLEAELKQGIVPRRLPGRCCHSLPIACQQLGYAILHKPYTHHKRIPLTLGGPAISWSSPTPSSTTPRPC